jgi:hypothetical protein
MLPKSKSHLIADPPSNTVCVDSRLLKNCLRCRCGVENRLILIYYR